MPIKRQEAASRPHSEQSERVGARKDGWTPTLQWEAGKSAATCKWFDGSRGNNSHATARAVVAVGRERRRNGQRSGVDRYL